jgi:ComF family protein
LCWNCIEYPVYFRRGAVAFLYEGLVRDAMLRLKFEGELSLAPFFAVWMARCLSEQDWPAMEAMAAVPSHFLRRAGRGFNLPSRLADELSRLTGIPVARRALRRTSFGAMPGSGRQERQELAMNAFAPGDGAAVAGRRVLLVDDITTTGATLNACARHLAAMGAAEVYTLVAAGGAQ